MSIDPNTNQPVFPPVSSSFPFPVLSGVPDDAAFLASPSTQQISSLGDSTQSAADSTQTDPFPPQTTINLPQPTSFNLQNLDWGRMLQLIWSVTSDQQEQQYKETEPTAHQKGMHEYAAIEAAELMKIQMDIQTYIQQAQAIAQAQQQHNQFTQSINNQMQQLTTTMNQAIQDHNDGKMNDKDFQKAVDQYNAGVTSLTQAYQQNVNAINDQINTTNNNIDLANTLGTTLGLTSIASMQNLNSTLSLSLININTTDLITNPTGLPTVTLVTIPNENDLINSVFEDRLNNFINSMQMVTQLENATDKVRDSYFEMLKLIFPSTTTGQLADLAGSTSPTNLVVSMISRALQAGLNKAVFQSLIQKENIKSSEMLLDQLQTLALTEIVNGSLYSVLGTSPNMGDQQAIIAKSAVNFTDYISKFIRSDSLDKIFSDYAEKFQLSDQDVDVLKAAFSQTLLTVAVSNLANTTGMYGLPTQLLGNLPGFQAASTDETPLNLKDIFSDPGTRQDFEEQLINLIMTKSRTNVEAARVIADNVVGALQLLDSASPKQIHDALVNQFSSSFDPSVSTSLANASMTTILNSRLNTELDQHPLYVSNVVIDGSQYLNSVQNQQSPFPIASLKRDSFVNSLALLLEKQNPDLSSSDATIDANSIWEGVSTNVTGYPTIDDLYKDLSVRISKSTDLSPDVALTIAQQVDLGTGNLPLNPLVSVGQTPTLSPDDLATAFNDQLRLFYTSHGVSPSDAQKQSDAVTDSLIKSPTSTLNLMLAIDDDYKKADIQNSNDLWVNTYRQESAISRELPVFIAATYVNPLLYSQLVTISGGTKGGSFQMPIQG